MRLNRASLLLIVTACAPSVSVTPTKGAPWVPSKADACEIEFFEIDALQRPYDVLAEVRVTPSSAVGGGSHPPRDPWTMDEMRRQACLLGADAVIGLHDAVAGLTPHTLVGTAVRYRR